MIEIIAETSDGIYKDSEEIKELLKTHKTKRVSNWWFLHGKLEDEIEFDKGIILDNDSLKYLEYTDKDNHKQYKEYYLEDGIYDIKIIQLDKPCKGYFWTFFEEFGNIKGVVPMMHGLVCYADDKEANEYAYRRYTEKAVWL